MELFILILILASVVRHQMNRSICLDCGTTTHPVRAAKGALSIEILLWFFFIFPGVLYTLWRRSSRIDICPSCKHQSMIPLRSPRGRILAAEQRDGKSFTAVINITISAPADAAPPTLPEQAPGAAPQPGKILPPGNLDADADACLRRFKKKS